MNDSIAFDLREHHAGTALEVIPVVAGERLTDRIHRYERERGMETRAISYGGLVPAYFQFGSAAAHWFSGEGAFTDSEGKTQVLACTCGEAGCWPLVARVEVTDSTVTWTEFAQPHRRDRDYSGFGPFVFDRNAYNAAVERIAARWATAKLL